MPFVAHPVSGPVVMRSFGLLNLPPFLDHPELEISGFAAHGGLGNAHPSVDLFCSDRTSLLQLPYCGRSHQPPCRIPSASRQTQSAHLKTASLATAHSPLIGDVPKIMQCSWTSLQGQDQFKNRPADNLKAEIRADHFSSGEFAINARHLNFSVAIKRGGRGAAFERLT